MRVSKEIITLLKNGGGLAIIPDGPKGPPGEVPAGLVKLAAMLPAGDVDGDGQINALDVQLVINSALGIQIPSAYEPDSNCDGGVDATDVQKVINAALGL